MGAQQRSSASKAGNLVVRYRAIAQIKPDPKNARLHDDRQIRKIADSIKTFGFCVPLLVDGKGKIIAGHGRLLAALRLGLAQVPTITLDNLSSAQIRAFMIADNRLSELATWSDQLLAEQLEMLAAAELDFDLEVTGFETAEIDLRIESLRATEDKDVADELPEIGTAVARKGDLWLLGKHRVLCGDATKDEDLSKLMSGKRAATVLTDPPFNSPIDRYVSNFGKVKHTEFAMASGEMSPAEFTAFLERTFKNLATASVNGALHYIFIDWRHLPELLAAGLKVYSEWKNLCTWIKNTAGQGSLYRSQHELVAVFKSGKDSHRNNIQLGKYGRYRTNVWSYDRVNGAAGNDGGEDGLAHLHPTVKPVGMIADAILDSTARGDIVLDAFLGSGTTVIAAERTGRICYGLEIDPKYVDVIIRRWQTLTGKAAVHAKSKKTFREMEEAANGK